MTSYTIGPTPNGVRQVWYLKPGQTLENTKISDRQVALLCTPQAWTNIHRHLSRNEREQQLQLQEQSLKEYLKVGSLQMRKNWPDSVENIRAERFKALAGKKAAEKKKQDEYLAQLLKENEEERKQFVEKMKQKLFMETDASKALTSSVILAETLHERAAQVAFMEEIRKWDKEENDALVKEMLSGDVKEEEKREEEIAKQKVKDYKNVLLKQILENAETAKKLNEKRLEEERVALDAMAKEMKAQEKEDYQKHLSNQSKMRNLINQSLEERKAFEERLRAEQEEEDRINAIYREAKQRMSCTIAENEKKRRKEAHERTQRIGNEIYEKFMKGAQQHEDRTTQAVSDAHAKREAEENARKEFREKLKAMRIQEQKEHVEREKQRLADKQEMDRWEQLNQAKNLEVYNEYLKQEERKRKEQMCKTRDILVAQDGERYENEKKAKEQAYQDMEAYKECLRKEDKEFLDYAAGVIEDRKSKGRPVEVIERVVEDFKIKNGYMVPAKVQRFRDCLKKTPSKTRGTEVTKPEEDPTFGRCHCHKNYLFQ